MSGSCKKRPRKPSKKFLEAADGATNLPKEKIYLWCTVEEERTDGSRVEHCVNSKYIETELGDPVGPNDLYLEGQVIWRHKGVPYQVTILDTHRTKPVEKTSRNLIMKFSDDDSVSTITRPQKKQKESKLVRTENSDESSFDIAENIGRTVEVRTIISDDEVDNELLTYTPKAHTPSSQSSSRPLQPKSIIGYQAAGHFSVPFSSPAVSTTPTSSVVKQDISHKLERMDRILKLLKSTDNKNEGTVDTITHFITENGINLMSLTAKTPDKYALQLMDVLFTDEEMRSSCFIASKYSTKPGLDPKRVILLQECLKKMFGDEAIKQAKQVRTKCTQKCIDKYRSLKKEPKKEE